MGIKLLNLRNLFLFRDIKNYSNQLKMYFYNNSPHENVSLNKIKAFLTEWR